AEALGAQDDSNSNRGILVRAHSSTGEETSARFDRAAARVLCRRQSRMPTSVSLVGRLTPESAPAVVVQEPGERVVAFQVSDEGPKIRTLWNVAGRGMHEGSDHRSGGALFTGVCLGDLTGAGRLAM